MPKVLVVEDDDIWFRIINQDFNGKVEVLRAKTLTEGDDLFRDNPEVDLIIMDACVPGDFPNAMPLVKKIINSGYVKPIIACSSMSPYIIKLVEAGATHQSDKGKVAEMALKLLNL